MEQFKLLVVREHGRGGGGSCTPTPQAVPAQSTVALCPSGMRQPHSLVGMSPVPPPCGPWFCTPQHPSSQQLQPLKLSAAWDQLFLGLLRATCEPCRCNAPAPPLGCTVLPGCSGCSTSPQGPLIPGC